MNRFVQTMTDLAAAVPALIDSFNTLVTAVEHVVVRLAGLWFVLYVIYKTVAH